MYLYTVTIDHFLSCYHPVIVIAASEDDAKLMHPQISDCYTTPKGDVYRRKNNDLLSKARAEKIGIALDGAKPDIIFAEHCE